MCYLQESTNMDRAHFELWAFPALVLEAFDILSTTVSSSSSLRWLHWHALEPPQICSSLWTFPSPMSSSRFVLSCRLFVGTLLQSTTFLHSFLFFCLLSIIIIFVFFFFLILYFLFFVFLFIIYLIFSLSSNVTVAFGCTLVAPVPFVDWIFFPITSPRVGPDKASDFVDVAGGCCSTEFGAGGSGSTPGVDSCKLFEDGPCGTLNPKVPEVVAVGLEEMQLIDCTFWSTWPLMGVPIKSTPAYQSTLLSHRLHKYGM